jgi:hypothetical protein
MGELPPMYDYEHMPQNVCRQSLLDCGIFISRLDAKGPVRNTGSTPSYGTSVSLLMHCRMAAIIHLVALPSSL